MNVASAEEFEHRRSRLSEWASRRRRRLGIAGTVVSAGMATLWTIVVPEKANATQGFQELTLRWGHPLCWALLAVVGVLIATGAPKRLRDATAIAAGVSYLAFAIGMVV